MAEQLQLRCAFPILMRGDQNSSVSHDDVRHVYGTVDKALREESVRVLHALKHLGLVVATVRHSDSGTIDLMAVAIALLSGAFDKDDGKPDLVQAFACVLGRRFKDKRRVWLSYDRAVALRARLLLLTEEEARTLVERSDDHLDCMNRKRQRAPDHIVARQPMGVYS
jgi:hypothetical protein